VTTQALTIKLLSALNIRCRGLCGVCAEFARDNQVQGRLASASLPDAQTLVLVEKPRNGGVMTKEIPPVRFSQLEGVEAA